MNTRYELDQKYLEMFQELHERLTKLEERFAQHVSTTMELAKVLQEMAEKTN